jgi:DNA-binding HxlR family transcriptional regulator
LDGLLYSDDIKVREIAYLLAFGTFMPANSGSMNTGNSSIWTSLASSSITSQLNNLLAGVLSDNWSIGTDLHSNDANFSELDMDVNISTRMFNDRLILNGTVGYHNSMDQINNFTGDFDLEYKLTPKGNVLLQFYNVTNNRYYDRSRSPLTQGAGIVYKREARTFNQLFGK